MCQKDSYYRVEKFKKEEGWNTALRTITHLEKYETSYIKRAINYIHRIEGLRFL